MVFDYVAVRTEKDECDKIISEEIILDGRIIAKSKDVALVKVGVLLGEEYDENVEISLRPF